MGAHPAVFARLTEQLATTRDRHITDELLDLWFDHQHRATDWDAARWGFNPDRWMETERAEMARHCCTPRQRWPWSRPTHI